MTFNHSITFPNCTYTIIGCLVTEDVDVPLLMSVCAIIVNWEQLDSALVFTKHELESEYFLEAVVFKKYLDGRFSR